MRTLHQIPDRIPRVSIVAVKTPVRLLSSAYPNGNIWVKDDSKTHPVYGGNKPRKLEFLLAAALGEGKDVLTFGFESSNHALATAYHAKNLGVKTHLVLIRGPDGLSAHDSAAKQMKQECVRELAEKIHVVSGFEKASMKGLWEWLKSGATLYMMPPGGSNALGSLGFVDAGFELARQIEAQNLPRFDRIFIAHGTAGTATGLAVGLAAAGLQTRVMAVKVVPGFVNERAACLRLAANIRKLVPEIPRHAADLANFDIESGFLGDDYGSPLAQGTGLIKKLGECEQIAIEDTYTGKALAALETYASTHRAERLLFWNTYSPFNSP